MCPVKNVRIFSGSGVKEVREFLSFSCKKFINSFQVHKSAASMHLNVIEIYIPKILEFKSFDIAHKFTIVPQIGQRL